MLASLRHYWRIQLAVLSAVAVTTAVLTGALLVGDSVRGSLKALALDRLGSIEAALLPGRFFREGLAEEISGAPAILLRGAAVHAETAARASRVAVHGVDERFVAGYGGGAVLDLGRSGPFPSAVVNESLRAELGAAVGDAVLLHFERRSAIPRESLLGETDPEDVLDSVRVTVKSVLPDRGIGRFGWGGQQEGPKVFVALRDLQKSLDAAGRANAVFTRDARTAEARLGEKLRLEDLGLAMRRGEGYVQVESEEYVLRPEVDEALVAAGRALGTPLLRSAVYVWNAVGLRDRRLPYSMVAALDARGDEPEGRLLLEDGSPAPPPGDGILLDRWAAEDLDARPGDTVDVRYFVVDPEERLVETTGRLVVRGIVEKSGLAVDRDLAPEFPGIEDADDMGDWDPPFPVDLSKIRPRDEEYWDRYRTSPKLFVSRETAEKLWGTRFGTTTAVRYGVGAGGTLEALERELRADLAKRLVPATFGFRLVPLREEGLRASSGATDFGGLFIGFSMFLIVSSVLLVGLLFRLGAEGRAGEIGLLLATGYRLAVVRRRWMAEAAIVAGAGSLVGLGGAVLYAGALMTGLRTLWRPAVGTSELYLYAPASSLALGFGISILVVLTSLYFSVRRLARVPPTRLLAGDLRGPSSMRSGRVARPVACASGVAAAALSAFAFAGGREASPALASLTGVAGLVAGLAAFSSWSRPASRSSLAPGPAAALRMAARNSAWNPGRSMLSVALVASASFVIVTVAANREGPGEGALSRESGSGGFSIVAESDVPLYQDLGRREDRLALGFSSEESAKLEGVEFFSLRRLPGDDASCLNLYRPDRPRVLGVPASLVQRGGLEFQAALETPAGQSPWSLLERPLADGAVPAIGDANSVQWILHLGLGRDLSMNDSQGAPVLLRIAGTLRKSIFQSELLISEQAFVEHFPDRTGYAYFLVDAPPERAGEVLRILESRLAAFGFDAMLTREKLAAYKAVENTYLSTFQVLGGLGLLLGTLGLGIVLVRNVIERRGELATLRACGFRASKLGLLVVAENAFLLLVGIGVGTVSALVAVAPRLATLHPPWGSLAGTLGAVIVVGLMASVAAVVGALRVPLLGALKAE